MMSNDNQSLALDGLEDTRQALLALLEGMRRSFHLYTPYVDPRLYDDEQVMDTIRTRIVNQPRLQLYLLLPPAAEWQRDCPRLRQLSERLSSSFELRTPPKEESLTRPELTQSMMVADEAGLLHLTDPRRFTGSYTAESSASSREMMNFFKQVWERSELDIEMRRFKL